MEVLSHLIEDAKRKRILNGIKIGRELSLSHLLFGDDVPCFCSTIGRIVLTLRDILQHYKKETRMEVNERKLALYSKNVSDELLFYIKDTFPFQHQCLDGGFKYLGFNLRVNT